MLKWACILISPAAAPETVVQVVSTNSPRLSHRPCARTTAVCSYHSCVQGLIGASLLGMTYPGVCVLLPSAAHHACLSPATLTQHIFTNLSQLRLSTSTWSAQTVWYRQCHIWKRFYRCWLLHLQSTTGFSSHRSRSGFRYTSRGWTVEAHEERTSVSDHTPWVNKLCAVGEDLPAPSNDPVDM